MKPNGGWIRTSVSRPSEQMVRRFSGLPVSILSDCLERMGTLDARLRPVNIDCSRFVGSALTVEEIQGGNLMSHLAMEYIRPGDVLVVDAKSVTDRACFGGIQALSAKLKGAAAIVLQGATRDHEELMDLGIPVFCIGFAASGPHKGWGGRINHPISVGGSVVSPGDILAGDSDGIVAIPSSRVEEILALAQQQLAREQDWITRVKKGELTADILDLRSKIAQLNIRVD